MEVSRGAVATTWEEALARLETKIPAAVQSKPELRGKVVTGYQGWFGAEGDGSGLGWRHYGGQDMRPGNCTFDLWPDMTEMEEDEAFPTPFRNADGSSAMLFSSYHPRTVDRHFRWMKTYRIDGAMLQRFGVSLGSPESFDFGTAVMQNVRAGAARHGRGWAMMYDLSGMQDSDLFPRISEDWRRLVGRARILADGGYIHHQGRPLVAIWGVGFSDDRKYGLEECAKLVDFLKNDPVYGGNAVMLGIPYYWQDLDRDTVADPALHALLKKVDIISPWSIGRYGSVNQVASTLPGRLSADLEWSKENGVSYLPVIFPGFSWQNLERARGRETPLNAISRERGNFLWRQALEAKRAGAEMIYVAMFDEVDEGTAIFKGSNTPPVGASSFMTYEGLPADHYLWLTGNIGRLLRGEIGSSSDELPARR